LRYRAVKKNYDNMLSRFHLIPERQGRTDRFAISISRVSVIKKLADFAGVANKNGDSGLAEDLQI